MNHGGGLRPECRAAWAACYARFVEAHAREGIAVRGFTVQNEPAAVQRWDSCVYTAEVVLGKAVPATNVSLARSSQVERAAPAHPRAPSGRS
jgi:O-glycosyl hydrolase